VLIPVEKLSQIWQIKPSSILHVGAHQAEELKDYKKLAWAEEFGIIWVEAQEDLIYFLRNETSASKNKIIHAAIWDEDDIDLELKITNNSQSSSLLELGTHKSDYPDIGVTRSIKVRTKRLDTVLEPNSKFEFLNLDIQGVELRALRSLGERIAEVKWIYTEVNKQKVYKECALISEIDLFLQEKGFTRVATYWVPGRGWGDALYIANYFNTPFHRRCASALKFFLWKVGKEASRVLSDFRHVLASGTKNKKHSK
jgi:FkbM family methyltransferase